jgi:hypothetical protein
MPAEWKQPSHAEVQKVSDLVRELKKSGAITIGGGCYWDELAARIQEALDNGHAVMYIPKGRHKGGIFNPQSFINAIREVLAQVNNYRVLIEPDIYGPRPIVAVGPLDNEAQEQNSPSLSEERADREGAGG